MQQPSPGQGWPQQFQQQQGYGQPPSPYPPQQGQWAQQPYTPYPPQQGQWQQPITPNPQWSQLPYGQPPPQPPERKKSKLLILMRELHLMARLNLARYFKEVLFMKFQHLSRTSH